MAFGALDHTSCICAITGCALSIHYLRDAESLASGHTVHKGQSWDLKPGVSL